MNREIKFISNRIKVLDLIVEDLEIDQFELSEVMNDALCEIKHCLKRIERREK